MSPHRRDPVAIVAGVVLMILGGLLLADRAGGLTLGFGVVAPLIAAALGAILLASGLDRSE